MLEQLYSAPPILGLVGLAIAFFIYTVMSRREIPDGEVQKIGEQIHLGAMVFMKREYTYLLIFAAVLLGLILMSDLGNDTALSFVVGASSSALAGWLGMYAATKANVRTAVAANEEGASQEYEVFSAQRLEELQSAGKPVFVNMTAAWCITCLANEQTTLGTERVKAVMADRGITYMKGDWTNEDPEITAVLEHFNRPSVPLYVLYPGQKDREPVILPQILTPGIVAEAFESI